MNKTRAILSLVSVSLAMALMFGCEHEERCGGEHYDSSEQRCCYGDIVPKNVFCNHTKQICGGVQYYGSQFCYNGEIYERCGGYEYSPYSQRCENDVLINICGGVPYDTATHFCYSNYDATRQVIKKCEGKSYDRYEGCCGNKLYSLSMQICQNGVLIDLCGDVPYDTTTHFCNYLTNQIIERCGGATYDLSTQRCRFEAIETKCGESWYNETSQFCFGGNSIVDKCGTRKEAFDPNLYECREQGKIYLKTKPKDGDGQEYDAVLIGDQVWMAENLNYNANGSICYKDIDANCATYGRLYDWATAKRGICPSGWHVSSYAEWEELISYVWSDKNDYVARYLKSTSGWASCDDITGTTYTCEDAYGFAALPSGYGNSDGSFYGVGLTESWWTTDSMDNTPACSFYFSTLMCSSIASGMKSIRCVKSDNLFPSHRGAV